MAEKIFWDENKIDLDATYHPQELLYQSKGLYLTCVELDLSVSQNDVDHNHVYRPPLQLHHNPHWRLWKLAVSYN